MAIFGGIIAPAGSSQLRNINGTANLSGRTLNAWRQVSIDTVVILPNAGAVIDNSPITPAVPRTVTGQRACSFFDDFYNRIYLFPSPMRLGSVASDREEPLEIWSAFLDQQSMNAVSADLDNTVHLAYPNLPVIFAGLETKVFTLEASGEGLPEIDTTYTFTFQDGLTLTWAVTGTRVAIWTFAHNWQTGLRERLGWLTNVISSQTGVEQRRALRVGARRHFEVSGLLEGRDRRLFDMAVFDWGSRLWSLPMYHDVQWIGPLQAEDLEIPCETENRELVVDGLVLLQGENAKHHEVVTVREIHPDRIVARQPLEYDWPAGTKLYPMKTAQLVEPPEVPRRNDNQVAFNAEFYLVEPYQDDRTINLPTYRGWPVLERQPQESGDLTSSFHRLRQFLDNQVGKPLSIDTAERAFPVMQQLWWMYGLQERSDFRGLLNLLNGRQKALWVPTWSSDVIIVSSVNIGLDTVDIEHMNYSRHGLLQAGRRDIRVALRDGQVFYARVVGAAEVDDETERLQFESGLPAAFDPEDVYLVSWMVLSRCEQDEFEISHMADVEGAASSSLMFRGVRDEL